MVLDHELHTLAAKFFRVFSRAEYALKHAGYHCGNGDAKPDWRKFARSVETTLVSPAAPALREAVDYVSSSPPKKQVIRDGMLEWDEGKPSGCPAENLLTYVCRIRNNLFHGGKFNGHWFEPERSETLLRHGLVILLACVEASPEVKQAYQG